MDRQRALPSLRPDGWLSLHPLLSFSPSCFSSPFSPGSNSRQKDGCLFRLPSPSSWILFPPSRPQIEFANVVVVNKCDRMGVLQVEMDARMDKQLGKRTGGMPPGMPQGMPGGMPGMPEGGMSGLPSPPQNMNMQAMQPARKREETEKVDNLVRALNENCQLLHSEYGKVPLRRLLDTGNFDPLKTEESAGWIQALLRDGEGEDEGKKRGDGRDEGHSHRHQHDNRHEHRHEEGEGKAKQFTSFVWRSCRPLHPKRLQMFLLAGTGAMDPVLRSKGFVWIATRSQRIVLWSSVAETLVLEDGGEWNGVEDASQEGGERESEVGGLDGEGGERESLAGEREERVGQEGEEDEEGMMMSPVNEVVFIGPEGLMDEDKLRAQLQYCELTDEELQQPVEEWLKFEDPLPPLGEVFTDPGKGLRKDMQNFRRSISDLISKASIT
uniref:CobW C-terminal domain-containing protein n=1 Tax=Chromera velia CCMP2878 TaxID=1169474 RepID=A0A0G4G601_9ALVE|eukprot:Cvel_20426.t1-p1 / transcript=Cvel_20426.t1 / gene=Cvel_20426 / organism=Chromera_velia_CCMP2878 / gene_product=hypothetical protein / transcript_product=hypothetical protein / location=Cvel_scaffold1830:29228-32398(-) / protein_length=438 / sequence_SO=supercontig / SO=protein_coding / is_pseudo=false